jgi:hypothetical protein
MAFKGTEILTFTGGIMMVIITRPWRKRNKASLFLTLVVV